MPRSSSPSPRTSTRSTSTTPNSGSPPGSPRPQPGTARTHAESIDGTRLPDDTTRLLCCDPILHVVAVNGLNGQPLAAGRAARFANRTQRRAAQVRDGGCVFPGCDATASWCDLHHVVAYPDGPTDLTNLASLCRHHHRVTHRAGWTMHTTHDGWFWWQTPTGRTFWSQRHQHQRHGPNPPPTLNSQPLARRPSPGPNVRCHSTSLAFPSMSRSSSGDVLDAFSPAVRAWFASSFPSPTAAQEGAWGPIAAGEHTLLCAPTGSGKTLAAFLSAIDTLGRHPRSEPGVRMLYISPLRALAVDVDKNLRSPLRGIRLAADRLGERFVEPTVGLRTGDSSAEERRALVRHPPDILITTPESLYLMLTSAARETLLGVESVIVDEIHALAQTKRGAHLSLSLERLEHLLRTKGERPVDPSRRSVVQRIGLSATQRPLEVVAEYLGGLDVPPGDPPGDPVGEPRPVHIVDAGIRKVLDLEVVVPVDDMGALGQVAPAPESGGPASAVPARASIWPSMHPALLALVEEHHSTLVFVNARRLSERLASRLNELHAEQNAPDDTRWRARKRHRRRHWRRRWDASVTAATVPLASPVARVGTYSGSEAAGVSVAGGTELVKAHHGSLSRERRLAIEDELDRGDLRGLVATSSLELGIDMGAVDLVVQVASPGSVASGLQRIGRAGHQVGAPSRGRIFPKHRADLLEAAVVVQRMHAGLIEHTSVPANPLDVLAQQIVASCALDDWSVDDLYTMSRASSNFRSLSREVFDATLDMLAGRYPAEDFAELRPRVVWDRIEGNFRGRAGAQRLAVTSGGTIPDRGLFGVFLPDGTRVGELDEEMVYESRVGETFLLGASTWRIEDITFERVVVTPAPGQPGKMPFWHGDGPGRAAELGRAMGEFVRAIRSMPPADVMERLRTEHALDERAALNLVSYLEEQAEATGVVPDDRTLVVERFRDEIGDWRICIHSPFGARVHAPWATVLRTRLADHFGDEAYGVEVLWSDDGIVIRLPEAADDLPTELMFPDPDEIEAEVVATLPGTAAFASRFRECSARALLLPRRRPDRRTPLWQQRRARRRPVGGGGPLSQLPDAVGDHPGVLQRRLRPSRPAAGADRGALPADPGGPGRDAAGLAVRPIAPVRVDRRLHVRGRRSVGRASGRCAQPGP